MQIGKPNSCSGCYQVDRSARSALQFTVQQFIPTLTKKGLNHKLKTVYLITCILFLNKDFAFISPCYL